MGVMHWLKDLILVGKTRESAGWFMMFIHGFLEMRSLAKSKLDSCRHPEYEDLHALFDGAVATLPGNVGNVTKGGLREFSVQETFCWVLTHNWQTNTEISKFK